jgi:hypothetical protein
MILKIPREFINMMKIMFLDVKANIIIDGNLSKGFVIE